ncbi:MAG TPA: DUF2946 domain-containing protein [Ottowia sp.]|uniref:DUF2946 family protein n=1 Tax=Ottowia sp. TaxID=1898956 RepID=UPI002CFF7BA1|nr:DUF2946 family protein [Ottowia sp.]HMN21999.1 DUF2946 domain-containing protein [Ottowia sp.]
MGSPRRLVRLARMLLACFALALAAAVISPLVQPRPLQLVCSADGQWRLLAGVDDGQPAPGGVHALDCALCLPAGVPASALPIPAASAPVESRLRALRPHTHAVLQARAPLPPRGPPA